MVTFIATVHILGCIALIILVLMQDSKSGGVFTSQTTSNSLLGATGATSLAATLTKAVSVLLLVTCVTLAIMSSKSQKSIIDSAAIPMGQPTQPVQQAAGAGSASATETQTAPQAAPAATTESAQPVQQPKK